MKKKTGGMFLFFYLCKLNRKYIQEKTVFIHEE